MDTDDRLQDGFRQRVAAARGSADYQIESVIDGVTEAIVDRMLELGMSRRDLAGRLNVTPARVTRLLRGVNNFTVKTLVEVSIALDCDLAVGLVPHGTHAPAALRPPPERSGHAEAAEARAIYGAPRARTGYASRDGEIREHLRSGKLRVRGDLVEMRRDSDGTYRPAKFRGAGDHSALEKTNVGRRAYYRHRILALAREAEAAG